MKFGRVVHLFLGFCISMVYGIEVPRIRLNNDKLMPAIALGTYLGFDRNGVVKSENKEVRNVTRRAIDIGWRHFDTATVYGTESEVGEAIRDKIREGVIRRDDVFVTTKLWNTHHRREQVGQAVRESLQQLGLDYIDLYLMHWPIGLNPDYSTSDVDYLETWRSMEEIVQSGLVKSIGVSNFNQRQLARLYQEADIKPAALQIEIHPQIIQSELVKYAQSLGLVVMGYSPFGSLVCRFGMNFPGPKLDDPKLVEIARKYGKTVPQVILRWLVDRNIVPIPKTIRLDRLEENLNIFDFKLTDQEIDVINSYDRNVRYTLPSFWQNHPYYPFEKVKDPIPNPFKQ